MATIIQSTQAMFTVEVPTMVIDFMLSLLISI
jgi:hypothetical protein